MEYEVGALDEPVTLYMVFATLRLSAHLSDDCARRLNRHLQQLVPLSVERHADHLVCQLLCTAPSAQAAAWKSIEHIRDLDGAVLVMVEAGVPGDAAPQLVLTSEQGAEQRPPDDDGPEEARWV